MKMLSLELEDILYDNTDKADEVIVRTIVGDFKIMDKADVADVSAIVGFKDVTSKLKFKMNFSGCKGCMLACKTPRVQWPLETLQRVDASWWGW